MRRGLAMDIVMTGVITAMASSPAWAGLVAPTPAPVVGVGIGAVALMGIGYRVLKRTIRK